MNFIWYYNCPEDSDEFADIMTDCDGHRHVNSLPIGKMRDEVWAKQRARGQAVMPPALAELLDKTRQPFISTISDSIAPRAAFFDGKLLLVGDAFALFRPHIALSTNQAALHCLLSEKLLTGRITIAQWEDQVLRYGRQTRLLSIAYGTVALVGGWTAVYSLIRYLSVLIGQWLLTPRWKSKSRSTDHRLPNTLPKSS